MNPNYLNSCVEAARVGSQFGYRMGVLSALRMNSLVRSMLQTAMRSVDLNTRNLQVLAEDPNMRKVLTQGVNEVGATTDQAVEDLRNRLQSALLMQEESAVWMRRIFDRVLPVKA